MNQLKGKVAIVGIGEVPTGRFPDVSAIYHGVKSARMAIADAGISKDDIDYIIPTGSLFDGAFNNEMVTGRIIEEMGLSNCKKSMYVFTGGSSSGTVLNAAAAMIISGMAKNILFIHVDKLGTGLSAQGGIDLFSTAGINMEWEVPFGQHYSSIAALATGRYQYETGTPDEELASICVSNRKWAELNPNAFFRKPLSVEEVLASKILSTPLHAKESNMLFDGGAAMVLTSAERAKDMTDRPVYILGEGSDFTHHVYSQEPDLTRFGWAKAGKEAFEQAGLTPADIDIAEIYDSYPIYQLITFEELGFCERGEGGKMFLNGDTWPGGKIPCTTNGGMLSQGHTGAGGGVAIMIETARQLMGKAEERQVPNARYAVKTATGGTYVDSHVTVLGSEIP